MAITTTTISRAAGWAKTDVIDQIEEAFTWLGWHGETHSGIVTGLTYSGGGDINAAATYSEVYPSATTGIGTGATFYVTRASGGTVNAVYVNRPGYGYTQGESLTLPADSIGGSSNGAADLTISVLVAGNASPIGYGATNAFYDKQNSGTYPWAVVRHTIQPNKKYGDTYHVYQMNSNTDMAIGSCNGFHPWDGGNATNNTNYYPNRLCGETGADVPVNDITWSNYPITTSSQTVDAYYSKFNYVDSSTIASSTAYQLDLNIYRSSVDPNFAVFSFKQPTLSSTHLTGNSFATWFHHNYTSSLWDLDNVYLGTITYLVPTAGNTTVPAIQWYTMHSLPKAYSTSSVYYGTPREAWYGFADSQTTGLPLRDIYKSRTYSTANIGEIRPYYRSVGSTSSLYSSNFNAAIKNIPASLTVMPVPYYLPEDFVLIDFYYPSPSANIQQGDTVTIGSESYVVITGSYNQTSVTRGILFCARVA
jgi:hypothetical protein